MTEAQEPEKKPRRKLSVSDKLMSQRDTQQKVVDKLTAREGAARRELDRLVAERRTAQQDLDKLNKASGYEERRGEPVSGTVES